MMRKFWPLLMAGSVGAMSVQAAPADIHELLVGSYTAGTSEGIYRLQFDSSTGQFSGKPVLAAKTANPSWLTISKDQKQLFVVNENGPGQEDPVGRVSSYSIDPQNHQLTLINQVQSLGNEPTHSSVAADGRYLFVANYSVVEDPGGSLAILPVDASGKPCEPGAPGVQSCAFGGVVAGRQVCICAGPGGGQGVCLPLRPQGQS